MFKTGFVAAAAIAIVSGAQADPETARKRLEASAQALKDATSISYTLKTEAKGMVLVVVEGKVQMLRQEKSAGRWIARVAGDSTLMMDASDPDAKKVPYDIVIDADYYTWIDHEKKRVMQRIGKGARDAQITVAKQYAWISELAGVDPFQLAGKSYESIDITGQETVEGVECDVIELAEGANKLTQTWYIATSDNLPRRLHRKMGAMLDNTYTVKNLKLNSELDPDSFEIATPEGYVEDKLGNTQAQVVNQGVTPAAMDLVVKRDAPAFELQTADGSTVKIEDLKGKVVVLEFLLTYSGLSKRSGPEMKAFIDELGDKPVEVISLPMKERDRQKTLDYFENFGLTQTVLHGGDDAAMVYAIRRYPSYVVVDQEGKVAYETGFIPEKSFVEMGAEIDKLLTGGSEQGADK